MFVVNLLMVLIYVLMYIPTDKYVFTYVTEGYINGTSGLLNEIIVHLVSCPR